MFKSPQLYNGVWTKVLGGYHVVLAKQDYALVEQALYVFHWHGLLESKYHQSERKPSSILPHGFYVGLPGIDWISGLSRRDLDRWLILSDSGWGFEVPELITLPIEIVERNRGRLRSYGGALTPS